MSVTTQARHEGIGGLSRAKKPLMLGLISALLVVTSALPSFAGDEELKLPAITSQFGDVSGHSLLMLGLLICVAGFGFGLLQFMQVKNMPVHPSMAEMSELIYETCKTYMITQGKFLAMLWVGIAVIMGFYFKNAGVGTVVLILGMSVLGILGSYSVAWFGCRMNTYANSRTAFASLRGKPYNVYAIPLQAGMSIGVLLISLELVMMLIILLFVPKELAGACFVGFAIGESLGASALRICGGIFTKIADIGSDLMKIVFNIKEDDARNPGVIADCTGDNAGDSVGPTADGFETYGVTGVALISFIALAAGQVAAGMSLPSGMTQESIQSDLLVWIFVMRIMMILTSIVSYYINELVLTKPKYVNADKMDFEHPLTVLVWLTSIFSIAVTFVVSKWLLGAYPNDLWMKMSVIISCGTLAAAIIPELTKAFTSASSRHVAEVVASSREGGASLNVLAGMVAGNFSGYWMGIIIAGLMGIAYYTSTLGLESIMIYPAVFAYGLVAFGMLGMGPVTIAVDSYGPVTDNAQSIYELSLIENVPDVENVIERDYGFKPAFDKAKHLLEENDGAGNTFKATAKPVLIGTAVVGATTMIFSIILKLAEHMGGAEKVAARLSLVDPMVLLGLICGGATVFWFCGASMQAVVAGSYKAVEFIKANIKLDDVEKASIEDSKKVVGICTQYAQMGMINIFGAIFSLTLAFACFNRFFFIAYLVSIAVFGLYEAIYMANAGGAWDNAKKVVEVELKEKGTELHAATVVGDTVGDPYKDTSSVALNPVIKFTTLFGLLAAEMAMQLEKEPSVNYGIAIFFFVLACGFVYRSFYGMRIVSAKK